MKIKPSFLDFLIIIFSVLIVTGCDKASPVEEELKNPQLVTFDISAKENYSGYSNDFSVNIKLNIYRRSWNGGELLVWDTIIQNKRLNVLQPFEISHLIKKTDHSTGILTASGYIEYLHNDNLYSAELITRQLEYTSRNHKVEVRF